MPADLPRESVAATLSTKPPESSGQAVLATIDSHAILGGRTEIIIRHQDQFYRLRVTKSGRLLLNK
jgi:hemin uptake protein HemP